MSLLEAQLEMVESALLPAISGRVQAFTGLTIEASDLSLPIGSTCRIVSGGARAGGEALLAEVIGFQDDRTLLMSLGSMAGVSRGDRVDGVSASSRLACSDALLGHVLDGFGRPLDGRPPPPMTSWRGIDRVSGFGFRDSGKRSPDFVFSDPNPEPRTPNPDSLSTGVRAIDALLTCGHGQRMGIFAGPGVGKSTLLSRIARDTGADVTVIALIGERKREVEQFLHESLGPEGLARSVVVVCTGEEAAPLRLRAARVACTIAEYFRDRHKHVLLLMDSLTRLCHGQRQVALAAREAPVARGYPASVLALLPQILERAGRSESGSITGFYTVLTEGDHVEDDFLGDAVKGIVDGQIRLRASLANSGHYPAIDCLRSVSRLRDGVIDARQLKAAQRVLALLAAYEKIEDLVNIGAYVPGVNPEFDLAVKSRPHIMDFLKQESHNITSMVQSRHQLFELVAWIERSGSQMEQRNR